MIKDSLNYMLKLLILISVLLPTILLGGCFKSVQLKQLNWNMMDTPVKRNCLPITKQERFWCINNKTKVKNSVCKKARTNYVRCVVKDNWIIRIENNWPFNS